MLFNTIFFGLYKCRLIIGMWSVMLKICIYKEDNWSYLSKSRHNSDFLGSLKRDGIYDRILWEIDFLITSVKGSKLDCTYVLLTASDNLSVYKNLSYNNVNSYFLFYFRQEAFMENYFASQRDNIFRNVEVLIYVFDVESHELEKDMHYYQSCLEAILQNSPEAKVFCLVHKMDLVQDDQRELVTNLYILMISWWWRQVYFYSMSNWYIFHQWIL